ncbi:MAG: cell division protein CrgA [Micrococcales bacterium]|nr:cell division protein CrgA [Micrococcales bacterium]
MPKSRPSRKQSAYTPPSKTKDEGPSPQWYKVTMVSLMVGGLAWVVATYLGSPYTTAGGFPIPEIGQWNLAIGFVLMMVGFAMTTKWR